MKRIALYARNVSFSFKNGYIQLPFLANSPEEMIEGFKKIPFSNVDEENGHIWYSNFCIDAHIRYVEVEQGLWFMITKVKFKKNICSVAVYDAENCEYFSLFYNIRITSASPNKVEYTNARIKTKEWALYKPKSRIIAYISEGTEVEVFNFFFDRKWLNMNINFKRNSLLKEFLDKNDECIVCDDYPKNDIQAINMITSLVENQNNPLYQHSELKKVINDIINSYLEHLGNSDKKLSADEYSKIVIIEKILPNYICQNLPEFDIFTKATKCCDTTLRTIIRKYYGEGGLKKEHHKRRMILAAELIKSNKDKNISDIARVLGYDYFSKFSTAYKNFYGYPPIETPF